MEATIEKYQTALEDLFMTAKSKAGLQYLFSLLRVDGITKGPDPLIVLRERCRAGVQSLDNDQLAAQHQFFIQEDAPLNLLANLTRNAEGKGHTPVPLQHLYTRHVAKLGALPIRKLADEVSKMASNIGKGDIAEFILNVYPSSLSGTSGSSVESLRDQLSSSYKYLSLLLEKYFEIRLRFRQDTAFHKCPNFEVLEFLVNEEYGLYGFNMYFSNGSSARFVRNPDSTDGNNHFDDGDGIGFMVGNLDDLKKEWRVGEKRLYEIGLKGRYNALGMWKPIEYPANVDHLQKEAYEFSDDWELQGLYFYMLCSGHRVIEFVARMNIELPSEYLGLGGKLHLWKCPKIGDFENVFVYDGWLEVDQVDEKSLRSQLAMIGIGLNRLAFTYGGKIDWRVKYSMLSSGGACAVPSGQDLQHLESVFSKFPKGDDAIVLDAALDWFNRGSSSSNVFTSFLCYYVAIELVGNAFADGEASFGFSKNNLSPSQIKEKRTACIKEKYEKYFAEDPIKFVRESYFNCIDGLKKRTRLIVEQVFGPDHPYLGVLFDRGSNTHSLQEIRSEIAHGNIALVYREHEDLVRKRIHEVAEIAKEFLTRLIFCLKKEEEIPSWSRQHMAHVSTSDPRATLVRSGKVILGNEDWRIRPEWCDR